MFDEHLYPASYFTERQYGVDVKRARAYQIERSAIERRSKPGMIFDFGCGCGDFLATFGPEWEKHGWDISAHARSKATQQGLHMVTPYAGEYRLYDVVVFRGTLQHIDTPVRALHYAYQILKPGGLLAILATPNTESVCYQLFKTLPALDPERNWFIPGKTELENVLHNIGFSKIETRLPYWGGPYAQPLKDFASFILALFGSRRKFAFPGNMMEVFCVK